jgi:hypothetical protein
MAIRVWKRDYVLEIKTKDIKVFLTIGFPQSAVTLYIYRVERVCHIMTHKTYQNYIC